MQLDHSRRRKLIRKLLHIRKAIEMCEQAETGEELLVAQIQPTLSRSRERSLRSVVSVRCETPLEG